MKDFLAAFLGWFVGILVLLIFFGNLIFSNAYALIALAALLLALVTVFVMKLAGEVEELQKRLDALEGKTPAEENTAEAETKE